MGIGTIYRGGSFLVKSENVVNLRVIKLHHSLFESLLVYFSETPAVKSGDLKKLYM